MKNYIQHDEWKIIEEGFVAEYNRISESIFSLGNGYMGQRANFEEKYSGDSLQGSYIAGIYYPDKTRVGWWKNGYPEYFAKILNSANWIGINVDIAGEPLDLAKVSAEKFSRVLNMHDGYLERSFTAVMRSGKKVEVNSKRFVSAVHPEAGLIRYSIKPINFSGEITLEPYVDANVTNADSNYDEQFWSAVEQKASTGTSYVVARTKKTDFLVSSGMQNQVWLNNEPLKVDIEATEGEMKVLNQFKVQVEAGQELTLDKFASIATSMNHAEDMLIDVTNDNLTEFKKIGFDEMLRAHTARWHDKWEEMDIIIEGDVSAQQAIRFNIYQLYQTYTGEDARLNIGPKGFTGEKYGGVTYWDTEAYCLPFYLRTSDQHVARNLLKYRHNHLGKAIENAEKLGFKNGAALYPMVTINGEECHNEWEITFEEIHRNGAIAFAIFNYVRYSGDQAYLAEYGLEVLIALSRFWAQRVNWSEAKQQYVMLGVTGPNEYENNVTNNWYTTTVAIWTMQYTLQVIAEMMRQDSVDLTRVYDIGNFKEEEETKQWQHIIDNMFFGEDKEKGVFLQQDNFLDKDLTPAAELPEHERPIHEHWSWDRILRSCYIKQADVLQGIYMFENEYDNETIARNFDFYEPLTVHESSLSACIHSILAAKLGRTEKAYEMYLRTARLDLDDYNNDTDDGLHITSMGGTWMAIVEGFAGLRTENDKLLLNPIRPGNWQAYEFRIVFRENKLNIRITEDMVSIENLSSTDISIQLYDEIVDIKAKSVESRALKSHDLV